jgi:hypothetical protein
MLVHAAFPVLSQDYEPRCSPDVGEVERMHAAAADFRVVRGVVAATMHVEGAQRMEVAAAGAAVVGADYGSSHGLIP